MMQDYQQELGAIRTLLKKNPNGMSVTDISKALKKNKNTVGRYLDILLISGQVDMRTYGMAKVYSLSQRVPLSAMLSYSKELIMVLDSESRILDVNVNFLRLLRLSREEVVGKNVSFLQSPQMDVHELLENISPGREETENTIAFQLKDRGERIFHEKCIPTVFDDGQRGTTIILEDVTERILAEREIRKSEERFRMMAENIQDGLIIVENERVVFANRRINEITGYSNEEMSALGLERMLSIGEIAKISDARIIPPDDKGKIEELIRYLQLDSDTPGEFKVWIRRKDGAQRFVQGKITAAQHGKTASLYLTLTDITDFAERERILRERIDALQDLLH